MLNDEQVNRVHLRWFWILIMHWCRISSFEKERYEETFEASSGFACIVISISLNTCGATNLSFQSEDLKYRKRNALLLVFLPWFFLQCQDLGCSPKTNHNIEPDHSEAEQMLLSLPRSFGGVLIRISRTRSANFDLCQKVAYLSKILVNTTLTILLFIRFWSTSCCSFQTCLPPEGHLRLLPLMVWEPLGQDLLSLQ